MSDTVGPAIKANELPDPAFVLLARGAGQMSQSTTPVNPEQ
jgi:hypothetical protein